MGELSLPFCLFTVRDDGYVGGGGGGSWEITQSLKSE
jgi:hypothetical protein